jgi:hypothetical protein
MPPTRVRRDNCPSSHSIVTPAGWIRGTDEAVEQIICADGREQFKMRCRRCQTTGGPISPATLNSWGLNRSHIEIVRHNEPRPYDPCSYRGCGVTPTEYHHFAPRNTFGPDADSWPCLPLCREHHVGWHQTMDGYRWHRKGEGFVA